MRPRATSRNHIDSISLRLFLTHGYANVTTDDLVQACGVSRPTFFRYVSSRDAIVLDHIADFGESVAMKVRGHGDRHAWEALQESMCEAIDDLDPTSHTGMAFRILQNSTGIRSSALELTRVWRGQLKDSLVASSHFGGDEDRCEAAAAMAIGLFQMTLSKQHASATALRRAFDAAPSVVGSE